MFRTSLRGRWARDGRVRHLLRSPVSVAAIVGTLVVALAGSSTAAGSEPSRGVVLGPADRVDLRLAGVDVAPSRAQVARVASLGDVELQWGRLGTPRALYADGKPLTAPSRASFDAVARGYLRRNAVLFRQQPEGIAGLRLAMNHRDRSGLRFLRYEQLHGPREVHGSSLVVALGPARQILFVGGTLAPSLGEPEAPELTADEAFAIAAESVSPRKVLPAPDGTTLRRDPLATTFYRNTIALPAMRSPAPVKADLVTVPTETGGRTAWRVRAEVAVNADYEVLVDAESGQILYRQNHWSHSEPHGRVHTGDDPEAGGQVSDVLLSGIDGSWVDVDTTSGNNVNAYQDLPEDDTPNAGDQPVNADQHFDYTFSNSWGTTGVLGTGEDRDAVVTQLFYYTNWFHDYAYGLGFTETAGNFQNDNFGRGGTGGDAVRAESDDGYGDGTQMLCLDDDSNPILCRNNANFNAGGADGSLPRMQMYVGEVDLGGGVTRRTQRAMNRDTVIHEYAHGITGRIISDSNLQGGLQSGALGEGWSDAFATSINDDPVYGEYNNGNYTTGIRGVAYDSSDLTYSDLCTVNPSGCQVHSDGTIWATAMWEQRTALRAKHGAAAGKAYHERLLMLGLFGTPDTPSFHDARTGYLAADAALDLLGAPSSGNQCLIWRVFADNELGVTAAPDADDDSTPTVSTATPASCDPQAVIAPPPASTPEGTAVALDGTGSVANGDDGDALTFAWDLDNDGDFDDSTSSTPSVTFGDNGNFTVRLQVTNTAGYTDVATAVVVVTNVAPTVTIDAAQVTSRAENQALSVLAHFSDPGWLDTYSSSVDPGTTDVATVPGTLAVTTQGPPQDVGTVQATLTYGDNGSFTVTVSVTDDDGGTGSEDFDVTVTNVDPTATIDESGTTLVNGVPTVFADEGEDVPFSGRIVDPGSDDETTHWDWGDGTMSAAVKSQVNPPADDPLPSPTSQPRDFTVAASHAWTGACMYDVVLAVVDDDGGNGDDTVKVLITAPPSLTRGAGYWQHQYRGNGKIDFTTARLDCYLEIAAYLSNVFNEVRDASTREAAHDDIFVAGLRGDMTEQLDRQLLTAWLNFANGGVEYDEVLDTDGVGGVDTAFVDVMATAETVRLNAASTRTQLQAQRDILTRINQRDGA